MATTKKNLTYNKAMDTIAEILEQIETGELDVDELAGKVKQASELLRICRNKLFSTEKEIEQVLKEMESNGKTESDEQ
jgi:exodeoxyribonuclease VII small subunit